YSSSYEELIGEFVRPFDLSEPSLIRVKLVKRDTNHYLLLVDMHHIISDGLSINLLMNDFTQYYQNKSIPPLYRQYKDYSEWMKNRNLDNQRAYWLNQFSDEVPVLDLPYDYNRPTIQSFSGNTVKGVISKQLKEKVEYFTQLTNTTDYMVLLSAFVTLLHRYSRQEDIVVGSPISGRTHKDTEGIIGMFVNTLALRNNPTSNKTFKDLLEETKDSLLQAYDNQDYPFETLVEEVVETRDITRNPLFDVLFVLQNNESIDVDVPGWQAKLIEAERENAKFDLSMTIEEDHDAYVVSVEYATELFKEETINQMLSHYIVLLENLIDYSSKPIGQV
ncbi:condensation domain-containing protein, partial [Staphylococcus epidermidis]|uniref:condensation domain-containing protein n=1 Tax=Staphylococcus epidermidis TaxID=1282 RepID=UPI001E51B0B5